MSFVEYQIYSEISPGSLKKKFGTERVPPYGVWETLEAALQLRSPVLAFPVADMTTYQPLPGMKNFASRDPSLPNVGMIACIKAANGRIPTLWDDDQKIYDGGKSVEALQDVLLMKSGSTVEDVFAALKWVGAVEGEFVRAEGSGAIGLKPKLVKKSDLVGKGNRILKIITTKRKEWQHISLK